MLLLVVVALAALVVFALTSGFRVPSGVSGVVPPKLGWMSAQWLAEYRASHGS